MDKFVVKTPSASLKPKTRLHFPVNITANDRARNYPEGTFHVDDGRLFCSSCNVVVLNEHLRKFVVDKHLEAASHKRNAERKDGGKQQTLKTVAQVEKVRICHEWIKVCTAANIPLHKSDNPLMREFLQSHVVNGGAIPKCLQLRDYYLFDVYQTERASL